MLGLQQTAFQPPVNVPIMSSNGILSAEWRQFFNAITQFLISFQNVIPVPQLTTAQINSLTNLANGFIVYNTSNNTFQGYVDGAWKTFTLT